MLEVVEVHPSYQELVVLEALAVVVMVVNTHLE
jgi:hypothetical protein